MVFGDLVRFNSHPHPDLHLGREPRNSGEEPVGGGDHRRGKARGDCFRRRNFVADGEHGGVREAGRPPLTRFQVDFSGRFWQYTWSPQTESWNMFWSQPENHCKVYGLCGNLGFCNTKMLIPCKCLVNFEPIDGSVWGAGDFSGGCRRRGGSICGGEDVFEEVGAVSFDGAIKESFSGTRSKCENTCLSNCTCIGLFHNLRTNICKNLFGSMLNLRDLTSDSTIDEKKTKNLRYGLAELEKSSKSRPAYLPHLANFLKGGGSRAKKHSGLVTRGC